MRRRHRVRDVARRAVALSLSWIFTATTVWASAPPVVASAAHAQTLPPAGASATPAQAQDTPSGHGGSRDHDDDRDHDGSRDNDRDHDRDHNGDRDRDHDGDRDHDRDHDGDRDRDHHREDHDCCDRDGHGHWDGHGDDRDHHGGHHGSSCSCDTTFFGPKQYVRTTGQPNVYTDTIAVPASVRAPYILTVKNGDSHGSHRVSSANIWINGEEIAEPDDFNQHDSGFSRKVSLTPQTTLKVKLASSPGSYLTISLCGQEEEQQDRTPPQLTWTEPPSLVGTATPHLAVSYEDVKGANDPSASGVDTQTLVVTLDGTDVTSSFTAGPADASADVPSSLALGDGLHQLKATIRDLAGNTGSASTSFTVDTLPPELVVESPKDHDYLNATPAEVRGTVADADPQAAVECRVGTDSVPGTRSGSGSQATFTCAPPLAEGENTIEVTAHDWLAHAASVAVPVILDTGAPVVTIDSPPDQSWTALETITVTGHVDDASPVKGVTVNAVQATLGGSNFTAADVPVGMGHISAQAEDAAGNSGETSIQIQVDRNPPSVAIDGPPQDAWVLGPHVEVHGTVDDAEHSAVMVEVNGHLETDPAPIVPRAFHVVVDSGEGAIDLIATARDEAGNEASTPPYRINVDYTAPVINLSQPVGEPITNAPSLHVEGTVTDISPTTLKIDGVSVDVGSDGSFSADVPLSDEGERTIELVATDSVGLAGTLDLNVIVDRSLPEVGIVSPAEDDFILNLPVVVEGTVTDGPAGLPVPSPTVSVDGLPAVVTGQAWTITFGSLPDGPHTFTAQARDAAGNNSVPTVRNVMLDLYPPTVTLTEPAEPLLTRLDAVSVRGTVTGRAPLSVDLNGVAATVTGSTWEALVPLTEGDNTITAIAKSASGRESTPASVMVTRDSIPPMVLELQTPESIGREEPGRGRVDAADNLPGVVVEVQIDGAPVGPAAPPPYEFDIVAPAQAPDGASLEVTAVATDKAGNVSSPLSHSVSIASAGVLVGQVLADETGLPLPEATVTLETPTGSKTGLSDAHGGYSFPTGATMARVQATRDGMISVERETAVASGVGTVVLDSRLTALAEPADVGPDGLDLPKVDLPGPIPIELVLSVPTGAVSQPTQLRLTPLSAQGLPGLLPLGWSEVAAFDVRASDPVGPGLEATVESLPDGTVHLARFDTGSRAWTMAQPGLVPASGSLTVVLDGTGTFALVVPDADPAPGVPAVGDALPAVDQADLPPTAIGQASVEPSVIPPSGGTATGRLFVQSPTPLPSGTAVQAKVTEEFELASGQTASEEVRRQDILLYRAPLPADAPEAVAGETVLHAVLPVAPSRTFEAADLVQGKVHLDVLAGRESVRGKTGGNKALTMQSGGAILSVPAASLPEDTVVNVEEAQLSAFLPAAADVEPLSEVVLDFTGATLGTSAGLSIEGDAQAGETLLVTRVERVLGIPRLLVVALAEANGGRIAAVAVPDLPGIKEGGRYVFYRLSQPVGWVKGTTTLASTGARLGGAVVESSTLPFIGRSGLNLPYLLVTRSGTAQVSATLPGMRLVASGSVAVTEGGPAEAVPLDLAFAGAATTATVTPADGTLGVPVSVQVVIEATAALDPSSANLAKAKLFKGTEPVEVKLLLSSSGKRLAVVPTKPLEVSTEYTFTAAGLKDVAGEDVVLALPVTFTTKDFTPPVFNVDAIVFSYPEDGITKVTAPAGSLPPFSEVLILNSSNGAVLWLQVDNDGCIGCIPGTNELPASIDDRLLVTITDPQGNVVTFERSKFVKADGTVAIGPGGGTVDGPGGVELRIPSGALEKGVELSVEGLTAETLLQQFPGQVPDLGKDDQGQPLAHLAGGLKITSKDEPTFTKPIDLAFPVPDFTAVPEAERPPADKPEDAYYYVVRRLEGPCEDGSDTCAPADRKVLFQTIDHAFLECPEGQTTCDASEKQVVTASYPFGGYVDSFGGYAFPSGYLLIQPVAVAYSYVMWTYEQSRPGEALAGVVTGKVLRTVWNTGATVPQYEAVEGAFVTAVDSSGQRLLTGDEPAAITGKDGTFTLWDPRYVGGTVRVAATLPGVTGDVTTLCPPGEGGDASFRCGVAYEADPANFKTTGLRFHRNIATVNLTFPPVAKAPPPPAIAVTVYRTVNDKREDTRGIVPSGTPLILAVKPTTGSDVREVLVQGQTQSFRADPLKGQPTGADWIVEYTPGTVGTYRVEVTGLGPSATGLPEAVKGGTTFRVIGAGGTDEIVEGARPEVIPARTVPKTGASGVQISTYVQVVFTEPVKKIAGNVFLRDATGQAIAVKLSGVLRFGGVIEDLSTSPDAVITSLTVQPLTGLDYGATYTLELTQGIQDLDTTDPSGPCGPARCLVPYETSFTTFTPESLSQNPESFGSPGIVILGERAYLVQNNFYSGTLRVFETSDPVEPLEIPNSTSDSRDPRFVVSYRPVDLVGESDSPLTGGRVVAVVTGPTAQSKPSNVWLLDVKDDAQTQWIGAVSLTSSAGDGFVNRSFLRAGALYSATFRKGIQVVDLGKVKDSFKAPGTSGYFQMSQAFHTDGQGYGQENVVNIDVRSPFGGPARLNDIEAALVQTTDGAQVLVAAPGDPGLTVVNPGAQSVLWNDQVTYERDDGGQQVVEAALRYGQAIAMGNVAGQDLAVVVGTGTILQEAQSRPLLMVVSLYDPQNPVGLGYVLLDDATVGDVILKDDLALLGGNKQVTLVSLTDPARPRVLGTAQGVGGRLALSENGAILFSTERSVFGGTNLPLGGVRTATLGSVGFIQKVAPAIVQVDGQGNSTEAIQLTYRLIAPPEELTDLTLSFNRETVPLVVNTLTGLKDGTYTTTIPAGVPLSPPGDLVRVQPISSSGPGPEYTVPVEPQSMVPPSTFLGVQPDFASLSPTAGAPGASVSLTIQGKRLSTVDQVEIRNDAGVWTTVAVDKQSRTATSLRVAVPADLVTAGFLVVSPDDDASHGLAFLVGDTFPAPGMASGDTGITITSVAPAEMGPGGGVITVSGSGLEAAGSVVILRSGRGVVLPIDAATDAILTAPLPDAYVGWAEDLSVALVTRDGSAVSNALPVKSTVPEPTIDYTDRLPPDGQVITNVRGPLVWKPSSTPEQEIEIEGIGIGVGTQFRFSAPGSAPQIRTAEIDPPTVHPTNPPSNTVLIKVPGVMTQLIFFCASLQTTQTRLIVLAGATCLGAQRPVEVPLGGRRKIAAYRQAGDAGIYLVAEPDPQAHSAALTCPAAVPATAPAPPTITQATFGVRNLTRVGPSTATLALTTPSVPNAADPGGRLDNVPLVTEESNCFDQDRDQATGQGAFYLRGVRLPATSSEMATVTAAVQDQGSARTLFTRLSVTVRRQSLGQDLGSKIEDAVVEAASKTGVPPQFLKAQISHENRYLRDTLYRYEPLTQDYNLIGWEQASRRTNKYIARHLFQGTALSGDGGDLCVALVGPSVDTAAVQQQCSRIVPIGDAKVAAIGESGIVRGRSGWDPSDVHAPPQWRSGFPEAEIEWAPTFVGPPPPPPTLRYVDPAFYRVVDHHNTVPTLQSGDYQFDYVHNQVTLGKALDPGYWIKLTYRRMSPPASVGNGGTCAASLPGGLSFFDNKAVCWDDLSAPMQTFSNVQPQTIDGWFASNAGATGQCRGYRWVSGTGAERHLEFLVGAHPAKALDRRLEQVTAQFLAAGSFGLLQFTPIRWDRSDADILNKVFDLNTHCIWELADPSNADRVKVSTLLAAAAHSGVRSRPPAYVPALPLRPTQVEWANYWAGIIRGFNPGEATYGSDIVKDGLTRYSPD